MTQVTKDGADILTDAEKTRRLRRLAERLDAKTLQALEEILAEHEADKIFADRIRKMVRTAKWIALALATLVAFKADFEVVQEWLRRIFSAGR